MLVEDLRQNETLTVYIAALFDEITDWQSLNRKNNMKQKLKEDQEEMGWFGERLTLFGEY